MARSTARKRALNTLYEADEKGQDILSLLAERIAHPGAQTPLPDYAITMVHGVADHATTIDRALTEHSTGWNIKRMAVVDRNILRIATWEIIGNDEVPDKVAIDEALGLAKTLSDGESLSFIHGVLSSLCLDKANYDFEHDAQQETSESAEVDSETNDSETNDSVTVQPETVQSETVQSETSEPDAASAEPVPEAQSDSPGEGAQSESGTTHGSIDPHDAPSAVVADDTVQMI